ncbi:IQ and AAA domain-containing protein 1-like [Histomonas meleagridis]|uniref:IQ and AAA domain-containing protein 1-like n=1 Tax=Histomonas meleagridis TaxID=135588 RepID=UPI00355A9E98|nr:IQ and AAA domain-containing protein 1-like [Histomonas meleagridis]KAH0803247.1 IQ and AAA domain-containing protein 1-like [Histomonas meleagridis]
MSSKELHTTLLEAIERLTDIIEIEKGFNAEESGINELSRLFGEYLKLYSMLELCYDQTIQTQRRLAIRTLFIKLVNRFLELFLPITTDSIQFSTLCQTVMSQSQKCELEIPIPRIVKDDQGPSFSIREDLVKKFQKQFDEARIALEMTKPPEMPLEEAVLIVQRAERARNARHQTLLKKSIQQQKTNMRKQANLSDKEEAANIIKRFMKKYTARKKFKLRREEEKELIGMKLVPKSHETEEKVLRTIQRRKEEQRKRKQELEAAESVSKSWLEDNKAVDLRRELDRLCAEYYNETKLQTGKAPTIKAKMQVVRMLLERKDWAPEPELQNYYNALDEKKNKNKKTEEQPSSKPPSRSPSRPLTMSGLRNTQKQVEIVLDPKVTELKDALEKFMEQWTTNRKDEEVTDDFDIELVRKEMWTSMLPDIAASCEQKLKRELRNLKVLEMRRCRRARVPRRRATRRRRRKTRNTLNMTDEEVLSQLVGLGIIQNTPNTTFNDFIGNYDITSPVDYSDPWPDSGVSYATVRSQVIFTSVLPFACNRDSLGTLCPRGILIAGNKGTGKTTLAHAVINALGATYLDFSPSVLIGKTTPTPRQLVLMLIRAAKTLAPSVILVEDIDKMFGTRKHSNQSKKFKRQFRRYVRRLKPRDRVLLIGTTSFSSLSKICMSLFNYMIVVPKPNFPTRVLLWNFWLSKMGILSSKNSVNALAFASQNYTAGAIARACKKANRVKNSRTEPNEPITDEELLRFLADAPEQESRPQIQFNFKIGSQEKK